jgi:MFS-type transporter involved in bile tolerance (Atg22 family)
LQYTLAFTNCYWIVCGLPWFFLQKKRPGPSLPKGESWFTVSLRLALPCVTRSEPFRSVGSRSGKPFDSGNDSREFFPPSRLLVADGLNTTGTVVTIVQNQHIQFSFLESTYLGLAQAATSIFSCYAFWYLQRWRLLKTKWMFAVTNVITVLIPFWGMVSDEAKPAPYSCARTLAPASRSPPSVASQHQGGQREGGLGKAWNPLTSRSSVYGQTRSGFTTPGSSGSITSSSGELGPRTAAAICHAHTLLRLGQAPYYAYAQTMMSELTPPGYEGMFFGLFVRVADCER